MTIVTYHHRPNRARRKKPEQPYPIGRIVTAKPPRDCLWMCDIYMGEDWAIKHISRDTLKHWQLKSDPS